MTELGLSFQQSMALMQLEPDLPLPHELARGPPAVRQLERDRNRRPPEAAGLPSAAPTSATAASRPVALPPHGREVRAEVQRRAGQPPPELARLSEKEPRPLRDILRRSSTRP
jgi:hypothetical protein